MLVLKIVPQVVPQPVAFASAQYLQKGTAFAPSNVLDGNLSTIWSAGAFATQWIEESRGGLEGLDRRPVPAGAEVSAPAGLQ